MTESQLQFAYNPECHVPNGEVSNANFQIPYLETAEYTTCDFPLSVTRDHQTTKRKRIKLLKLFGEMHFLIRHHF